MARTQVVWFKRDLRVRDHGPLAEASRTGPVLPVYVFEPSLLEKPTTDPSHVRFTLESLRDLGGQLMDRGAQLVILRGELPDVFERLHDTVEFERIWSHEETGDLATYDRDRRVRRWCRTVGVEWVERPQSGVVRGPHDRNRWSRTWHERMRAPLARVPDALDAHTGALSSEGLVLWQVDRDPSTLPCSSDLGVAPSTKDEAVEGGEQRGLETLRTFLNSRSAGYRSDLSSPLTSWQGCSRLGPYLSYGNVSMRQVYRATEMRTRELKVRGGAGRDPAWLASLESFESRLRWHCHFVQKLEDEPDIERRNINRAFDGMRVEDPEAWTTSQRDHFAAWCDGRTGYPLVDAVVRALHRGGWINFRMRAMLASFVSHHLWLHWEPAARHLAPHFLDYEPGIHFPQFQMQAGTTGINAHRIYNPTKQVWDQDPEGTFIRSYVSELTGVPARHIAEPWRMSAADQSAFGCRIGRDYPAPIVQHEAAYRRAKTTLEAWTRRAEVRAEAQHVLASHGSRRRGRGPFERRRYRR